MKERTYICIDLKSFYASVECDQRNLDHLQTHLVVADASRTDKTICLAVSPSLKAYGIPGRARLFEVKQKVKEINAERQKRAPFRCFKGQSYDAIELKNDPSLALDFVIATPQMAKYIEYSTRIYNIYLKYVSKEDIHVYSIDEVFMDVTDYLKASNKNAKELAQAMIHDVLKDTGITATAGIGTNMYLAKVAMDIVAKHIPPDENGVRIAFLDEMSYRKLLWTHQPLTDFWRVGRGYQEKLNQLGLYTMGDIARCSIGEENKYYNEDLLYRTFGINAELLIDHAWGYEPALMKDIKAYKPSVNSISTGQVLHCAYTYEKAELIVKEMAEQLALDLVEKRIVTDQVSLYIGYDVDSLKDTKIREEYEGSITSDYFGRNVPKAAHGSVTLSEFSSSRKIIMEAILSIYHEKVDEKLLIRRINLGANNIVSENKIPKKGMEQLNLFTDYEAKKQEEIIEEKRLQKEKKAQFAILNIKKRYGKNAVIKGMDLEEGATTIDRNKQIGGHKA